VAQERSNYTPYYKNKAGLHYKSLMLTAVDMFLMLNSNSPVITLILMSYGNIIIKLSNLEMYDCAGGLSFSSVKVSNKYRGFLS